MCRRHLSRVGDGHMRRGSYFYIILIGSSGTLIELEISRVDKLCSGRR